MRQWTIVDTPLYGGCHNVLVPLVGGQKLAAVRLLRYCSHIFSKIGLMNKSYIFINYNFNAHSELELAAEAAIRDLE